MTWLVIAFCASAAWTTQAQDVTWRAYSPADSSFVVRVPGMPTTSVTYTETKSGTLPTYTASFHPTTRDEFQVSWTQYRDDRVAERATDALLARMRDALVQVREGTIVNDVSTTFDGRPARSTTFRTMDGRLVRVRFYFVEDRVYQLMTETADDERASDGAARFLESFSVRRPARNR